MGRRRRSMRWQRWQLAAWRRVWGCAAQRGSAYGSPSVPRACRSRSLSTALRRYRLHSASPLCWGCLTGWGSASRSPYRRPRGCASDLPASRCAAASRCAGGTSARAGASGSAHLATARSGSSSPGCSCSPPPCSRSHRSIPRSPSGPSSPARRSPLFTTHRRSPRRPAAALRARCTASLAPCSPSPVRCLAAPSSPSPSSTTRRRTPPSLLPRPRGPTSAAASAPPSLPRRTGSRPARARASLASRRPSRRTALRPPTPCAWW
mmetsp:Transcript_14763/g.35039  ORF Transcript_14763/g.35039 Transcript_14763/m.35039 type:complete len:264 (-) Transcript_14763:53-844(-)